MGSIKQISKKLLLKTKEKSYTVKSYQYIRTMRIILCINILITKINVTQETKTTHFFVNIVPLNKRSNVNKNI